MVYSLLCNAIHSIYTTYILSIAVAALHSNKLLFNQNNQVTNNDQKSLIKNQECFENKTNKKVNSRIISLQSRIQKLEHFMTINQ